MWRAKNFAQGLGMALFIFIGGGIALFVGYLGSDLAYASGLWPVGALMRISLLFALAGWFFGTIACIVGAFASLFKRDIWET